jgi:4-amino-4-deoxy-L-arabinose transferase-like glycosyltransferase
MISRSAIFDSSAQLLPLAAVALLVALLTLNRLGSSDVCGGSEAVMGVFVQQMVEHRDLLFPLDNCSVPMYKPPLFHWTASALDYILGQDVVNSFNLRLPSALYAIAGAIVTMLFTLNLLEMRGGVLSGLILAGSYQYIGQGRIGLVDMTLTFFETLSLCAFFCWFLLDAEMLAAGRAKRRLHYLFAATMGLGVLAKGPVGALLPGGAMVTFLTSERRWQTLRNLFKLGPLLAGVAVALSWYVACLIEGRFEFLGLQLGSENFGRFFGTLSYMPPWYYIKPLVLNSGPLSLLVPAAVVSALSAGRSPRQGEGRFSLEERAALCARFFAIFWIVTVVFFELSAFKRRAYLLPVWPASAVLLSWWFLDRVVPRTGIIAYHAALAMCLFLALGNFLFIPAYELRGCGAALSLVEMLKLPVESLAGRSSPDTDQPESYRQAAAEVNRIVGPGEPLFVFGIDGAVEPLLLYLARCAPQLSGPLQAAPAGYVIAGVQAWEREKCAASGFVPVVRIPYGKTYLVLLRGDRGKRLELPMQ